MNEFKYEELMRKLSKNTKVAEPLLGISGAVTLLVVVYSIFDTLLGIPESVTNDVFFVVSVMGPIVIGWLARIKVYSPKTVAEIVNMTADKAEEAKRLLAEKRRTNQ